MQKKYYIKRIKNIQRFLILFLILILTLSSCAKSQTEQPSTTSITLPPLTATTSASNTLTITPESTWTPVPTLPFEIQKQNLIELLSTNGGCNFPCWLGISSGDSIQKISEFGLSLGESLRNYKNYAYSYSLSLGNLNTPDLIFNYYLNTDQVVQRMEVKLTDPSRFKDYHIAFDMHLSLERLLTRYGKPSEVLFLVQPRFEPGETPRSYTLFVIYGLQDFGIAYSGLVDSEDPLQVCSIKLDNYYLKSISLYFHEAHSKIAEINRFNLSELYRLEEVTSMDLEDFYKIFSNYENNQCIEVSFDPWQ